MSLGEKIQVLRKQSGMSQEQLAERITISRQAISRWELNESVPDVDNIVQLSQIFGVSTDYLLKDGEYTAVKGNTRTNSSDGINPAPSSYDYGHTKEYAAATTKKERKRWGSMGIIARISLFCMITSPAIYLVLGFWFGWWHPGWLVFILPGMVFAGASASGL